MTANQPPARPARTNAAPGLPAYPTSGGMTVPDALFDRIRFRGNPVANPESVIHSGNARFSLLTERLIRLEWSQSGEFEDRSTYAFPTRFAPAPVYTCQVEEQTLVIRTSALELRYRLDSAQTDGRFTAGNLSIAFDLNGQSCYWVPGTPNPYNLRGARRTLDGCDRDAALDEGLLSRAGWSMFDDSRSVLFNQADGWVAPRPDFELQDWYFMAFGHDYKGGLAEYLRFGGPVPLIPRFVLGAWWSRYWAYSAQDLKDLVNDFTAHDLPLDVLVVDMDWHTPDGWTGYTWNRQLFPDPADFLAWVHAHGLRTTFNLHPAAGVQPFEEVYPRFAQAMGIDSDTKLPVPFRITDKKFVENYFHLLHHPMEQQGVDFWWMDWQQGEVTEMKGLDALPWINHLHFRDSTRRGSRPMLYSRWGGLGNHRYYIGFSGDTIVGWPALQFQPYMTATGSNVVYGWWSHDIGGHMGAPTEPELYARWVQFGALSPCLRLHATKDASYERRPWIYPPEVFRAAKSAFHLRYRLNPYLYSMARVAADTGVALCRPMYYEYPESDDAYLARYQYFFGDQMITAPFVFPADPQTGLAGNDVWIPEGTWVDFTTKEMYIGPCWVRLLGDLHRMPMLVKEAGILPQVPDPAAPQIAQSEPRSPAAGEQSGWGGMTTDRLHHDRLVLSIFPGRSGRFLLYEDDGISPAYQDGGLEWTEITTRMDRPDMWEVNIAPIVGRCDTLPRQRACQIRLEGSSQPDQILVDGVEITDWTYDPDNLVTTISLPMQEKHQGIHLMALATGGLSGLGAERNRQLILADLHRMLGDRFSAELAVFHPYAFPDIPLSDLPKDAIARLGGPFCHIFEYVTPEEASQQLGRVIVVAPADGSPYDLEVNFTLYQAGGEQRQALRFSGLTQTQVVNTPFAFTGHIQTERWEAQVQIHWRGEILAFSHHSEPLFPTINAWHIFLYNPLTQAIPAGQTLDETGKLNPDLAWEPFLQSIDRLRNVNDAHVMPITWLYRDRLQTGEPLEAYLATTVTSPIARQADLLFQGEGEMTFYLNGEEITGEPEEADSVIGRLTRFPVTRSLRRLSGLNLRAGENSLVLHTAPPQDAPHRWWYFTGLLTFPDGGLLTDVSFR
jgi:hypothetical protein